MPKVLVHKTLRNSPKAACGKKLLKVDQRAWQWVKVTCADCLKRRGLLGGKYLL